MIGDLADALFAFGPIAASLLFFVAVRAWRRRPRPASAVAPSRAGDPYRTSVAVSLENPPSARPPEPWPGRFGAEIHFTCRRCLADNNARYAIPCPCTDVLGEHFHATCWSCNDCVAFAYANREEASP